MDESFVYYWLLACAPVFKAPIYFRLLQRGEPLCTNPAMAMRWVDLEDAEDYRKRLKGNWTPILVAFDSEALCGGK